MQQAQDIVVVVDYHAENIEFRWFNEATGEERVGKWVDGVNLTFCRPVQHAFTPQLPAL